MPVKTYDPIVRTIHWLTLLLVVAVFAAIWTAHSGLAGDNFRAIVQLHRSLGVSVLTLTVFRLFWRLRTKAPALPRDLPAIQKLAAKTVQGVLYLLLIAQPLLGLIHTNARGQRVDFFFLGELPALVGPDKALARLTFAMHETAATVFLVVIGLHAAAALFHHFVRRDDVLNTMLPARLHGVGRAAFALRRPTRQI